MFALFAQVQGMLSGATLYLKMSRGRLRPLCSPKLRLHHQQHVVRLLFASMKVVAQDRIRLYQKKLQKLEKAQTLATSRRPTAIDVGAANRFITAAVTDLSAQQKAALQQVEHRNAGDRAAKRGHAEVSGSHRNADKQAPSRQSATAFLGNL